jgi:hypothetical protein
MQKSIFVGFAALLAAAPADATGGLVCRTAGADPIELALVIGHTALSIIVSARLREGGKSIPVIVAQSWLEPNEVRLDLTDRNATRHALRLRAKRKGGTYDGQIWRSGQRRWVRCREG